ncbi:hypothetical protein OUZ56_009961 [Daphnia magna]|uniref:Uncharacterized protein n=1 Tax=Daphnia magna TaxID=35525 RepID=A0ABR0AHE2_9CRUS|nr:hypothetical protein OUZ56_009961 [Daphnia magna]
MIDAPREEIRRCIIQKLGPAAWDYHPKAEFLNQKFNNKTLLHTSVKAGKLDITDLLLDYGADPDIEEDGQTIAHRAAAENNKLLIRILRYHKYKFSSYINLGETPLMVAIAYGHEEVRGYLWISSNVAQIAKDNSTVLHYAAKHGNNTLARAACERKIHININQTTKPGNYTALHLATMSTDIDPLRMPLNPLGSRPEIMQTVVRIQTHLEEDVEVSLPKQEVYEEYWGLLYGKCHKTVIHCRLWKKQSNPAADTPDLLKERACILVREWAEKLLGINFSGMGELANFLVDKLFVDQRSKAATQWNKLRSSHGQSDDENEVKAENGCKQEQMRELKRKLQCMGPSALFCPMVDQPWGGAVALSATSTTSESATTSKLTTAPTTEISTQTSSPTSVTDATSTM